MNTVLLSIKPEFVEKIFNGTKKYEFRKSIFKKNDINKVVVYSSFPVKKVVGEFTIDTILEDHPDKIWKMTEKDAGITEAFFYSYFTDKDKAFAIKIASLCKYASEKTLQDLNIDYAPQSFCYLGNSQ